MKSFVAICSFRGIALCSLVLAGIILYGRTLSYPFVFDCWTYIQHNPLITDLKYFSQLTDLSSFARTEKELGLPNDVATNFLLRPLLYLTFSANYLVHGLDSAGFRAVNIALHIFNALLVFQLLERLLVRTPRICSVDSFSVSFIPAFAAMLFLLHPMQTESVTYIVSRSNPLVTSFVLGTLLLYHRSVTEQNTMKGALFRWGSVAVMLGGMFVEESMVTAPLLLLLLETVCLGGTLRAAMLRILPHLCLLPVVPLLMLAAETLQKSGGGETANAMNILNYSGYSPFQYAVTQLCVIVSYLRLLLVPYGQNVDPDFPLYSSLLQWQPLGSLMLLTLLVTAAYLLFRRFRDDRSSLLLFGVGWFFLGLAPSSGVVPLPDLMVENRVYISSIGFFMVMAVLLDWQRGVRWGGDPRKWIITAAAIVLAAYGTAAWERNAVWSSSIRLWTDAAAKSPDKDRVWHNLGMAYLDEARSAEAITSFRRALSLNPSYQISYEALVMAYTREGRVAEAESTAFAGLRIAPGNAVLHNNLGAIYAETGQADLARQHFEKALQIRPGYESARTNLERLLAEKRS